jgi:hypothetical protein
MNPNAVSRSSPTAPRGGSCCGLFFEDAGEALHLFAQAGEVGVRLDDARSADGAASGRSAWLLGLRPGPVGNPRFGGAPVDRSATGNVAWRGIRL